MENTQVEDIQVLLNSGNFRPYNVSVAKKLNSINAAILLSFLINQYYYYKEQHLLITHRLYKGFWFYLTQERCEDMTALSRKEQDTALLILTKEGLIKKQLMGDPARRHFQIDEDKIRQFLLMTIPKTNGPEPTKSLNQNDLEEKKHVCPKGKTMVVRNGQTLKNTIKEDIYKKTTTKQEDEKLKVPSKKENSSSFYLNRNLKELEDLPLNPSQRHTLYKNFDDVTILNAINYYRSYKKCPDDLGAFLFAACRGKYKANNLSEKVTATNKELTETLFGNLEEIVEERIVLNSKQVLKTNVYITANHIEFSSLSTAVIIRFDDPQFGEKIYPWINKIR